MVRKSSKAGSGKEEVQSQLREMADKVNKLQHHSESEYRQHNEIRELEFQRDNAVGRLQQREEEMESLRQKLSERGEKLKQAELEREKACGKLERTEAELEKQRKPDVKKSKICVIM